MVAPTFLCDISLLCIKGGGFLRDQKDGGIVTDLFFRDVEDAIPYNQILIIVEP